MRRARSPVAPKRTRARQFKGGLICLFCLRKEASLGRIRYDRDIVPSEITPASLAFGRRRLLAAAGGLAALAWAGRGLRAAPAPGDERFRGAVKSRYSTDEVPTPVE